MVLGSTVLSFRGWRAVREPRRGNLIPMDIHRPTGPVESLKDFFTHLLIVTVGILIALSLEGLLEWRHHREAAEEARTNILSEIRANEKDLQTFLKAVPEIRRNQMEILEAVQNVSAHGKSDARVPPLSFRLAELSNTSWTTSQTVGALAFMPYAEVKNFAGVYQLQDEFLRLQVRTEDAVVTALSLLAVNTNPSSLSKAELDAERDRILASLSSLTAETQLGGFLEKAYSEVAKP